MWLIIFTRLEYTIFMKSLTQFLVVLSNRNICILQKVSCRVLLKVQNLGLVAQAVHIQARLLELVESEFEENNIFLQTVREAPNPLTFLQENWSFNKFDWQSLRLYPLLVHQLKVVMNHELKEFPTFSNFVKGPAFMLLEIIEDLVKRFREKMSFKPDSLRARQKRQELMKVLENKNPQVTGNNFFKIS